jgi:cellulose synthase (UDP-forming)
MHALISPASPKPGPRPGAMAAPVPKPAPHKRASLVITLLWAVHVAALIWFAAQDVGLEGQYLLGAAALAGLAILHVMKPTGLIRVLLFMLIAFVSIRYFT